MNFEQFLKIIINIFKIFFTIKIALKILILLLFIFELNYISLINDYNKNLIIESKIINHINYIIYLKHINLNNSSIINIITDLSEEINTFCWYFVIIILIIV